jgi:nucleotide-binding universal stress UspA family protein
VPSRQLRRSYDAGHSPKFLVLVDETLACEKAVYYASRRAGRVGAKVVLLRVLEPSYREFGLLGVADVIRTEAGQEAQEQLAKLASRAKASQQSHPRL